MAAHELGNMLKIGRMVNLHPRRGRGRRRDAARVWGVIVRARLRMGGDRVDRGQSLQGVCQGWGARWRQGTVVHFVIGTIAIGMDRGGRVSRKRCTHQMAHSKLAQRGRCSGLRCACSVLVQGREDVSRRVGSVPVDSSEEEKRRCGCGKNWKKRPLNWRLAWMGERARCRDMEGWEIWQVKRPKDQKEGCRGAAGILACSGVELKVLANQLTKDQPG